jgi:hypothetical protein
MGFDGAKQFPVHSLRRRDMATFSEVYEKLLKRYNALDVPQCIHCESTDTAAVECGVIRLTMSLSATCRKFKLVGNGPKPAEWYCNSCKKFFNEDGSVPLPEDAEYEPQNLEECVQAMKKHGGFTMSVDKLL